MGKALVSNGYGTRGRNALTDGDPRISDGTGSAGLRGFVRGNRRKGARSQAGKGLTTHARQALIPPLRLEAVRVFFRYPVSPEIQAWILANFEWAICQGLLTRDTPLVTLDKAFFTAPPGRGPETAAGLLADFQRILHIPEAQIDLLPIDRLPSEYRHDPTTATELGGTWQGFGNSALIRYAPEDMVHRPITFLATLGHEVMHHVLHSLPELPPGGPDLEEHATDLHCVTMGLGLLQLGGAEQAGWQGYLSQPTRAHALALFMALQNIPEAAVAGKLPPRAARILARARRQIDKGPATLDRLRSLF